MKDRLAVGLIVVALSALPAGAGVLEGYEATYSQTPWDYIGSPYTSDASAGIVVADDWAVGAESLVTGLRWWGSYLNDDLFTSRPDTAAPGAETFSIAFMASVLPDGSSHPNARPGPVAYLQQVLATRTFEGYDELGYGVYRYEARLPAGGRFDAHAAAFADSPTQGQVAGRLFLAIDKPSGEGWGWHDVDLAAPVLDRATALLGDRQTVIVGYNANMAFEVLIPEPATFGLALAGLAALVARQRRV